MIVGQTTRFTVDITHTNSTLNYLSVECFDKLGNTLPLNFTNDDNTKRSYSFTPLKAEKLILCVSYDGISVPETPYVVCKYFVWKLIYT